MVADQTQRSKGWDYLCKRVGMAGQASRRQSACSATARL
ncbi:hypothetical protein M3J09_006837 [Ascochyta lentis]